MKAVFKSGRRGCGGMVGLVKYYSIDDVGGSSFSG